MHIKIYLLLILFTFLQFSCAKHIIVMATKDATVSSHFPNGIINGKNQPKLGYGYGAKRLTDKGFVTYPVNYIGVGEPPYAKDAIVVGGFDLSKISKKIKHATLVLFVNYVSNTRKNVPVFIRPMTKSWNENTLTYLHIFKNLSTDASIIDYAQTDENKCKLVVCNFLKSKESTTIPNPNSKQWLRINVTDIVRNWQKNPNSNYGILIDPMWSYDIRYTTVDKHNRLSNLGVIEIACTEWKEWNGEVPKYFYLKYSKWLAITNRALGKDKYIPHLEITLQ